MGHPGLGLAVPVAAASVPARGDPDSVPSRKRVSRLGRLRVQTPSPARQAKHRPEARARHPVTADRRAVDSVDLQAAVIADLRAVVATVCHRREAMASR